MFLLNIFQCRFLEFLLLLKIPSGIFFVSTTFWFDAVNAQGEIVEIREGRFDMKY